MLGGLVRGVSVCCTRGREQIVQGVEALQEGNRGDALELPWWPKELTGGNLFVRVEIKIGNGGDRRRMSRRGGRYRR